MASQDATEEADRRQATEVLMAAKKYIINHAALARKLGVAVGGKAVIPADSQRKIDGWLRIGTISVATKTKKTKVETAENVIEVEDAEA